MAYPIQVTEAGGPLAAVGYVPPRKSGGGIGPLKALEIAGLTAGGAVGSFLTAGALTPAVAAGEASLAGPLLAGAVGGATGGAIGYGLPARQRETVSASHVRSELLPQPQQKIHVLRETPRGLVHLGQATPEEVPQLLGQPTPSGATALLEQQLAREVSSTPAKSSSAKRATSLMNLVRQPLQQREQPAQSTIALEQPCPTCRPLPKTCPQHLSLFAQQLQEMADCGALSELLTIKVSRTTGQVTLTSKRPICICASDITQIEEWAVSGGVRGEVQVVQG